MLHFVIAPKKRPALRPGLVGESQTVVLCQFLRRSGRAVPLQVFVAGHHIAPMLGQFAHDQLRLQVRCANADGDIDPLRRQVHIRIG
jgi:hypothetical protein